MNSKTDLKLDWCSYAAAKYSVEHWHYSRRMPCSKLAKLGVWESGGFVGCVLFGLGATPMLMRPYKLSYWQGCELVRVAILAHETPVSRIISVAIKILKKQNPGLRLIVSFADTKQGHVGTIYQASGWIYTGSRGQRRLKVRGQVVHPRTLGSRYGIGGQSLRWLREHVDPDAQDIRDPDKHRYLYPLDADMRRQLESFRKPYPKRAGSADSGTSVIHTEGGGAIPTAALL